ncbi:hypothetical protein FN846DRAFT_933257 [Sphaerosporella brunnea]|uniref:CCR4-NOT transcription complex subunit 11 n=1 Tax=Sphaerosporella brunnea TaxID=1250544 RepID=A0A5J5F6K4_9PEZI|nr:hypothetical protein FN846DRAFT_933257 [Sphaerosporella brunnea]
MTSTAQLPADLVCELLPFTESFHATTSRFLTRLYRDAENTFTRVCELYNTLDLLASSPSPMRHLVELRGGGSGGGGAQQSAPTGGSPNQDAEDLVAFMLNAEFLLYALYGEYDFFLNPNLSHWVSICREFDKYAQGHTGEWGLRERVLKIRASFVKAILGEHGSNLAKITPKDFVFRGIEFEVNLDAFRTALRSQGIYDFYDITSDDLQACSKTESEVSDNQAVRYLNMPSAHLETTLTPAMPSTPLLPPESPAQASVLSFIFQATHEQLSATLTDRILTHLSNNLSLLLSFPVDLLSSEPLTQLFDHNPILSRGLVTLILSSGSKAQRRELLPALEFLPISITFLETLNDLSVKSRLLNKDEVMRLVHVVLSNGIRKAEGMKEDRQMQSRLVRLLCLFLQSIIRYEAVTVDDVFYLIQELGIKFAFLKEAREFWKDYCIA